MKKCHIVVSCHYPRHAGLLIQASYFTFSMHYCICDFWQTETIEHFVWFCLEYCILRQPLISYLQTCNEEANGQLSVHGILSLIVNGKGLSVRNDVDILSMICNTMYLMKQHRDIFILWNRASVYWLIISRIFNRLQL